MLLNNGSVWLKLAVAAAVLGTANLKGWAEESYDSKSKILSQAPILVEGVQGDVQMTTLENTNSVPLKNGMKVRQGSTIRVGRESRVDLIFSNGAVLALDAGARLSIDQFLQAGGYDVASPLRDSKAVVDHMVPSIGQIEKEPSYSFTKIYLHEGTMYARVKKLHKKSKYEVSTALGKSKILGTTWRESVGEDRENLNRKVEILLQEGLIQFKPIDSADKVNEAVIVHPEEKLSISGKFHSLEAMNTALNVAVNVNVDMVRELIRDPEFAGLIEGYLPIGREEQITPRGPEYIPTETSDDSAIFGGDQGVGTVGAMGSGFGGSTGGSGAGGNVVPDPQPAPQPSS